MNTPSFPGFLAKSGSLGTPYLLTDEQLDWFRQYRPTTSDHTIARLMGVSYQTVRRMAARLGIAKDRASLGARLRQIQLDIVQSERRRMKWGLQRRTTYHLPSVPYTRAQVIKRWRAHSQFGYILSDDCSDEGGSRYVIYYDEHTRRNKVFERYAIKNGFSIEPWD